MFNHVREYAIKNKFTNIVGEFINTEKNIVAKELFNEHGFNKVNKKNNIETYTCLTNKIKKINLDLYE